MSHTVGMTTTNYVWDVSAGLPVVLQDGENTYVYGLDLISATDSTQGSDGEWLANYGIDNTNLGGLDMLPTHVLQESELT